jgi:bacillithiol biosynthesis cysteine-adding enzyme BshC
MEIDTPNSLVTLLPLDSLAAYPSLLSRHSEEEGILLNDPIESLDRLRSLDRFTSTHRAALVGALIDDLDRWGAPAPALDRARQLERPETYAVITGQQAGMMTGPLYTLYKAIGTIAAADRLAARFPSFRFVPVFWIEADDHDFEEARAVPLIDRSGAPAVIRYDDGDRRARHVGDRVTSTEGLAAFIDAVREALPTTEFADAAIGMITAAYGASGETLADGFARALYAMLGEETPLVLASSRNPALKRLAADIFAAEAADPGPLFDTLSERSAILAASGRELPIAPKPGALFITHDGERRSLDPDDSGYTVRGTDRRLSRAEAEELATAEPERFSPNVVLRPIVQDAIFPTAIYLGGPSEIAYLDQIRGCYTPFGMEAPAVGPRPFVMLLEPKAKRVLDGLTVPLEEFLRQGFDAAMLYVDGEQEQEIDRASAEALERLRGAFELLGPLAKRIDPTLEKSVGAAGANAQKGIEDVAKRLRAALKRKHQTEIDRLEGARGLLLPNGMLQERAVNPLYYIAKFGPERFRAALSTIDLRPGNLQIIEI